MKHRIIVLAGIALLALAVAGCGRQAGTPQSGGSAASGSLDFALKDLAGNTVRLSDLRGQVVLVDFWATWCPPCRMELPHLQKLQETYGARGFKVVAIAMDEQGASVVQPFVAKEKVTLTVLLPDGQVEQAFGGVRMLPTTFLIGPDGKIFKKYIGYQEEATILGDLKALKPDLFS